MDSFPNRAVQLAGEREDGAEHVDREVAHKEAAEPPAAPVGQQASSSGSAGHPSRNLSRCPTPESQPQPDLPNFRSAYHSGNAGGIGTPTLLTSTICAGK